MGPWTVESSRTPPRTHEDLERGAQARVVLTLLRERAALLAFATSEAAAALRAQTPTPLPDFTVMAQTTRDAYDVIDRLLDPDFHVFTFNVRIVPPKTPDAGSA